MFIFITSGLFSYGLLCMSLFGTAISNQFFTIGKIIDFVLCKASSGGFQEKSSMLVLQPSECNKK